MENFKPPSSFTPLLAKRGGVGGGDAWRQLPSFPPQKSRKSPLLRSGGTLAYPRRFTADSAARLVPTAAQDSQSGGCPRASRLRFGANPATISPLANPLFPMIGYCHLTAI
jgi:hypothetical protein